MCINQQKLHFKTQTQAKNKHSIYKIALVFILKNGVKNSVTHCFCPWNTSSIISINWRENVTQKLLKGGNKMWHLCQVSLFLFLGTQRRQFNFLTRAFFGKVWENQGTKDLRKDLLKSTKMFETKKSSEIILFCLKKQKPLRKIRIC